MPAGVDSSDGICLSHHSGKFQLFVDYAGNQRHHDHLLLRTYLSENEEAQERYSQQRLTWSESSQPEVYSKRKHDLLTKLGDEAARWWITNRGFGPLQVAVEELADLGCDSIIDTTHPWIERLG